MIGPKALPIFAVPNRWTAKKTTKIATAIGVMKGFEHAGNHIDAFERAEHRNSRRNDAVAIEQRCPEQTHDGQHLGAALKAIAPDQRH
jgi:hypothetical protein